LYSFLKRIVIKGKAKSDEARRLPIPADIAVIPTFQSITMPWQQSLSFSRSPKPLNEISYLLVFIRWVRTTLGPQGCW